MTEDRIITAAVVTSGEKNDGKQLSGLVEKSKAAGKAVQGKKGIGKNQTETYYFDVDKCRTCSQAAGCYTARNNFV